MSSMTIIHMKVIEVRLWKIKLHCDFLVKPQNIFFQLIIGRDMSFQPKKVDNKLSVILKETS